VQEPVCGGGAGRGGCHGGGAGLKSVAGVNIVHVPTTGKTRSSIMPEVSAVAEAGVPGFEAVIWLGLMAPAKTPPAILRRLDAGVAKIVARRRHRGGELITR
jgi:tripartite-type tricarboxylate transporter receptor subunit TctC